jgi:predicted transcriptional regulator of viral defense system
MGLKLLEMLASKGPTFTTADARQTWGTNDAVTRVLVSRLAKSGWIERLEKGKYMIIPLGAEKGKFTLHEFVLGSMLVRPYAIAYWSALHHHGLTDQIPATIFVQTTARTRRRDHFVTGLHFWVIRISERKFFGEIREWLEGKEVFITDPEKTVIDCLDKVRYSGGLIDVGLALGTRKLDTGKLIDYATRNGSAAVLRRLGYLCRFTGIEIPRPKPVSGSYIPLDPTNPPVGKKDPKWRVIVNTDLRELEAQR